MINLASWSGVFMSRVTSLTDILLLTDAHCTELMLTNIIVVFTLLSNRHEASISCLLSTPMRDANWFIKVKLRVYHFAESIIDMEHKNQAINFLFEPKRQENICQTCHPAHADTRPASKVYYTPKKF